MTSWINISTLGKPWCSIKEFSLQLIRIYDSYMQGRSNHRSWGWVIHPHLFQILVFLLYWPPPAHHPMHWSPHLQICGYRPWLYVLCIYYIIYINVMFINAVMKMIFWHRETQQYTRHRLTDIVALYNYWLCAQLARRSPIRFVYLRRSVALLRGFSFNRSAALLVWLSSYSLALCRYLYAFPIYSF